MATNFYCFFGGIFFSNRLVIFCGTLFYVTHFFEVVTYFSEWTTSVSNRHLKNAASEWWVMISRLQSSWGWKIIIIFLWRMGEIAYIISHMLSIVICSCFSLTMSWQIFGSSSLILYPNSPFKFWCFFLMYSNSLDWQCSTFSLSAWGPFAGTPWGFTIWTRKVIYPILHFKIYLYIKVLHIIISFQIWLFLVYLSYYLSSAISKLFQKNWHHISLAILLVTFLGWWNRDPFKA